MANNPFTLSFGMKPNLYVSRIRQTQEITDCLQSETPFTNSFMITGVRGAGKTVMLRNIRDEISTQPNWIVVELNPNTDMLNSLAAHLYEMPQLHLLFVKARLNFSFFGLGASFENSIQITDIEMVITKMLEEMKKNGMRLLVVVDEVLKTNEIRKFTSAYQIFTGQQLPIYLIMAGLYENIYELQNDKSLTFLYRAPKVVLEGLNISAMAEKYGQEFQLDQEQALAMARITMGYPYAFQLLGWLCWEDPDRNPEMVMNRFDQYLAEYVYEKIWFEMSEKDQEILAEIARYGTISVKQLRDNLNLESNKMAVYRDRLKRKGVIDASTYGVISLALPRFREYVNSMQDYGNSEEDTFVIAIPGDQIRLTGLQEGSPIDISVENGKIIISPEIAGKGKESDATCRVKKYSSLVNDTIRNQKA